MTVNKLKFVFLLFITVLALNIPLMGQGIISGGISGTPIDIGVCIDILQILSDDSEFELRAVELNIGAPVDPYFEMTTVISWHEGEFDIEEAFVSAILPGNFKLQAGRELLPIGYLNRIHEHDFPQADQPLVIELLTTDHGLIGDGAHIEWLAPAYNPVINLSAGIYESIGHSIGRRFDGHPVFSRLQTYWESGGHGLLAGSSYLTGFGNNDTMEGRLDSDGMTSDRRARGKIKQGFGFDLKYKYRPDGRTYRGLTIGGEYLQFNYKPYANHIDIDDETDIGSDSGLYAYIHWDFDRFWGIGYRYDDTDVLFSNLEDDGRIKAHSLYGEWRATEFSRIRLQYQNLNDSRGESEHIVFLQGTFIIGWHPPHRF